MFKIECPHCGKRLKAADSLRGRRIRCPSCRQSVDTSEPEAEASLPPWLAAICGIGILGLAVIGLAVLFGLGPGQLLMLLLAAAGLGLIVWQWRPISSTVRQALEIAEETRQTSQELQHAEPAASRSQNAPSARPAATVRPDSAQPRHSAARQTGDPSASSPTPLPEQPNPSHPARPSVFEQEREFELRPADERTRPTYRPTRAPEPTYPSTPNLSPFIEEEPQFDLLPIDEHIKLTSRSPRAPERPQPSKPVQPPLAEQGQLFELRPAAPSPKAAARPVTPAAAPAHNRLRDWWRAGSSRSARFYGPGESLVIDGVSLVSPLLYFVEGRLSEPFDASLIEAGLPVTRFQGRFVDDLPYWPTYREASPEQRRRFRDWLTGGRTDPDIEIGYVFIYFYGLERRVLVDGRDHEPVLREVIRLLSIYGSQNSFRRYASSFLWAIVGIAAKSGAGLPGSVVTEAMKSTSWWNDENLSVLLAVCVATNIPLPADMAFLVASQDPRVAHSVVVRRHPERFQELFCQRYRERFGNGVTVRAARSPRNFSYDPASGTLCVSSGHAASRMILPNVLGLPSQFKPLVELWSSAVEDLKAFDREHRKTDGREGLTAAMFEALPPELRTTDHPDLDVWISLIERRVAECGRPLIPVGELAALRGIPPRTRLTRKQCEQVLKTADALGYAVEPDARLSGESYRWNDIVSVFAVDGSTVSDAKVFHAAAILLRLGMTIATADGHVDETEFATITAHLEQRFRLTGIDSVRLEHLAHVLVQRPAAGERLAKKLLHLPLDDRLLIGDFLVGVAAADGVITAAELKALKKLHRHLELDDASLDTLTAGEVALDEVDEVQSAELVLDPDRIRSILAETQRVADLLQAVIVSEEDVCEEIDEIAEPAETPTPGRSLVPSPASIETCETRADLVGLDPRYHLFLSALLNQTDLSLVESDRLARRHSLMLHGALEAINEWSLENLGDILIEDNGSNLTIQTALLDSAS